MTMPLMPKATAVWLIEKTALTFAQIADFCGMHPLEVQAIADGEVAQGIVGYDPVANGQLTAEEIRRCEADPEARLQLAPHATLPPPKRRAGRATRPWPSATTARTRSPSCCATTRSCRRRRSSSCSAPPRTRSRRCATARHWNSANIKPRDPVMLGLCSQTDLNAMVAQANERLAREGQAVPPPAAAGVGEPPRRPEPGRVGRPDVSVRRSLGCRKRARFFLQPQLLELSAA